MIFSWQIRVLPLSLSLELLNSTVTQNLRPFRLSASGRNKILLLLLHGLLNLAGCPLGCPPLATPL